MIKLKRPGPLLQMTLALVGLCSMLVILADLFFGVLPDRGEQAMRWRKNVSESLAVQVAVLLQTEDPRLLQRTLDGVAARTEGLKSLAIRRADGGILAQAGDHARHWQPLNGDASVPEQVTVPLNAGGARWGGIELAFARDGTHAVLDFLRQPLVLTLGFISIAGTVAFGLYMRRALQHLDPASVIPERVQGAFDAMAEGVVVMDTRARVLLANKSFRALHEEARTLAVGQTLSGLAWIAEGLPADPEAHPWTAAIRERSPLSGITLEVGRGTEHERQLVIHCVPITDPGGSVRGCLATFDDVTELHRSNAALRLANDALNQARREVERQNTELERLATRDPLTGCLNRRAFHAALEKLLAEARAEGRPLSCVMIDIDHFKSVNDNHGHPIGDRVIQEVARKLLDCARATDLVGRYGGEEFCLVLKDMPLAGALEIAERVRTRVERECGPAVREVEGLRITASLGVEVVSATTTMALTLIDHADKALYRAKRGGRNQVCAYDTGVGTATGAATEEAVAGCLSPAAFGPAFEALLSAAQAGGLVLGGLKVGLDHGAGSKIAAGPDGVEQRMREVARIVVAAVRAQDLVVRLDEQHLGVVASGLSTDQAMQLAETIRARVDSGAVEAGLDSAERWTVSIGVDALPANAPGVATLVQRAGKALLRAQRNGRNQLRAFAVPEAAAAAPDATSQMEATAR